MRTSLAVFALIIGCTIPTAVVAQDLSLPDSAKLTRNDGGDVIALRLAGKSNLKRLDVARESIEAIAKLNQLQSLSLWGTTVDDSDIERLATLTKLRTINLTFTDATGKCLETLSSLPELVSVRLEGCKVGDSHLAPLQRMPQLAMLYLGRTEVTDLGLKHIRQLKNLNLLQLSDCEITDNGLASLGDLPHIQHLWLSKTIRYGNDDRSNLTDRCIDYLVTLDTLIDLRIGDSQLTEAGVDSLRDRLPNAKVSTVRTGVTYLTAESK